MSEFRGSSQPVAGRNGPRPARRFGQGVRGVCSLVIVLLLALGLPGRLPAQQKGSASTGQAAGGGVSAARGEYLVTIGGCNDCHTPFKMGAKGPEPDMSRMLSGHPQDLAMPAPTVPDAPWGWLGGMTNTVFAGPWGTSYTANLTSDPDTGVGSWDADLFIEVMRTGTIHTGTRPIMPPMPWPNIAKMTDEDLRSVFAYLMTVPPIKNKVPAYVPPAGGH